MDRLTRTIFAFVVVFCALSFHPALAFMDEFKVLEQSEITKLNDTQLIDTYIEVIVELEAVKTFHTTSGFKPKEYDSYKDLLRYRIRLLMEFHKRGIEAPAFDK
jgi:hypothetical protein